MTNYSKNTYQIVLVFLTLIELNYFSIRSGFRVETRQPSRKATVVSPETEDVPAREIKDRLMCGLFRL